MGAAVAMPLPPLKTGSMTCSRRLQPPANAPSSSSSGPLRPNRPPRSRIRGIVWSLDPVSSL